MLLVIGNKRYSSWSLRPWVLMKHFGIPFEEKLIPLDRPETREEILRVSPSGKVPALIDGKLTIWESLAIAEYLNEKYPDKQMWPKDPQARAWARAISTEMLGGFQKMREHMSHDLHKNLTTFDYSKANEDVQRVKEIWTQCLEASKGPFLFGSSFTIADAMFTPVVNRFTSYAIPLEPQIKKYVETIKNLPAHKEWINDAMNETLKVPRYE